MMNEKHLKAQRDETVVFLHIPKTAGCSLSRILASRFAENAVFHIRDPKHRRSPIFSSNHGSIETFQNLSESERSKYRCVLGHFRFGIHEFILGPSAYVTMLRDPVERVLSAVGQFNRMAQSGQLGENHRTMTVDEFCHRESIAANNHQSRFICGWDFNAHSPEENLQRALENLESHFAVIGTVERFRESLDVISGRFGWRRLDPVRQNIGCRRPQREQLGSDLLSHIESNNVIDRQLHEVATKRLERSLSELRWGRRWFAARPIRMENASTPGRPDRVLRARRVSVRKAPRLPKKRILIDANKLGDNKFDGIKRYVSELLTGLLPAARQKEDEWEIQFCVRDKIHDLKDWPHLRNNPEELCAAPDALGAGQSSLKNAVKRLVGQRVCRQARGTVNALRAWTKRAIRYDDFDLVHLTLPNTWYAYRHLSGARVTTVHDLSNIDCPDLQTLANRDSLRDGMKSTASGATAIISVSEFTKRQLLEHYHYPAERIFVTHEGCRETQFAPVVDAQVLEQTRRKYKIPDVPYILSLGTLEPRKNLTHTIRAFRRLTRDNPDLNANLVIAGASGWEDVRKLTGAAEGCERIRFVGYVHDNDLAKIYSGATALSYVSFYEGFGLPPLEAMNCGAPVIYGNRSAMPEVVGDAGLSVDPSDVAAIASAFQQVLQDATLRQRLSRRAIERSRQFRWSTVAERTLEVYEFCLNPPATNSSHVPNGTSSSRRLPAQAAA